MLDLESYRELNAKYRENVVKDILAHNPQALLVENVGTTTGLQVNPNQSSASRVDMQGTHSEQGAPIEGCEKRYLFTGNEREYGKYMFNVKSMYNCVIRKIITRTEMGMRSGKVLCTYLFVQINGGEFDGMVDLIEVPSHISNDYIFGYELVQKKRFRRGMSLREGEVLAESPSVLDGEWCVGTHANTILASDLGSIEDACIVSRRLAAKMNAWGYATHRMYYGEKNIPLLLYGDHDNPQMFPRVGDRVRKDGILMATRPYNPVMAVMNTTRTALRRAYSHYDHCVYVDAMAEVVDVKVYRAKPHYETKPTGEPTYSDKMYTPAGIQEIADTHANSLRVFYRDVRHAYLDMQTDPEYGDLELMPLANTLVTQAIAYEPRAFGYEQAEIRGRSYGDYNHALKKFGNGENIDDYMVEVTIRFPLPAAVSTKITDWMGGKGIIADVRDDEDMPIDDYGVQVDLIMSENAMLRRTNFNRAFEHFVNAARRDVQIRARKLYAEGNPDEAFDLYIDFFNCINPRWAKAVLETHDSTDLQLELLDELDEEPLRVWVTIDNVLSPDEIIRNVMDRHMPNSSKLTVTTPDGNKERTINKFIIGEIYMLRLNKTGREFSAIAAAKYQAHGTIAKASSSERYRRPIRVKPIRVLGQSEWRHLAAYIDALFPADIKDKSNNPAVQDEMIWNLLTAADPMNITEIVNRKKFPLGFARDGVVNNHIMACDGIAWTTNPKD